MKNKNIKQLENKIHKDDLFHGELYKTMFSMEWSLYIEIKDEKGFVTHSRTGPRVLVPEEQTLLFRSFTKYDNEHDLALFFWFERKSTICLMASKNKCYFDIVHVPWELREAPGAKQVFEA